MSLNVSADVVPSPANSMEEDEEQQPGSLLDLAAMTTARHISCEEMERHQLPLDEAMLKKVASLACPEDTRLIKAIANVSLRDDRTWQWAEGYIADDKVKDVRQVGFMVTAVVESCHVSFTFEKQQITSTSCQTCTKKIWCSHIIAAILYRIKNPAKVPIHAPVTETLSTLNQDQLQKLIQYAIQESPAGILGKVFRRVDQIRDATSEINETPGLPDPTFGLGSDETATWDLTVDEVAKSFNEACLKASCDFPCSFEESTIRNSLVYKRFLQRVINLVELDQVEDAGQILCRLATEAANVALARPENAKRCGFLLKTIERMCTLYILEFKGQARSDLILLCQKLNKTLNLVPTRSTWVELPPLSALFTFETNDVPGVLSANQKSMFYQPLCASLVPDPGQEFDDLLDGEVSPSDSKYNEPLPLMIMRFEALRLWNDSGCAQRNVLRLGTVILRKLIHVTHQLSMLSKHAWTKKRNAPLDKTMKRGKSADDDEALIPCKLRKLSSSTYEDKMDTTTEEAAEADKAANAYTEDMDSESDMDIENGYDYGDDTLTEVDDLLAYGASGQSSGRKLEISETKTSTRLQTLLAPSGKEVLGVDENLLSKETLSYCLSHICCCMYQCPNFSSQTKAKEKEVVLLASLRTLELSRFRMERTKRTQISEYENFALQNNEKRLVECFKDRQMTELSRSTGLQGLYIKRLCQCNHRRDCFFSGSVPLPLIAFLVKGGLENGTGDELRNTCFLCLYTVCHSTKPLSYYMPTGDHGSYHDYSDVYRHWMKAFTDITTMFLDHIKEEPDRDFWLLQLLQHYGTVRDGKALNKLWDQMRKFPVDKTSEDVQQTLLTFYLNCIREHNLGEANFKYYQYEFCNLIVNVSKNVKSKFTEILLKHWEDLVKYFRSDELRSLANTMKACISQEVPLSNEMIKSIADYFSGQFEHSVDSCLLLDFFEGRDKNQGKLFEVIRENTENFTTTALLHVAEKYMTTQLSRQKRRSGRIFSTYAEEMIKKALKRIRQDNINAVPSTKNYSNAGSSFTIFPDKPDQQIQWVFKTFVDGSSTATVNNQQFVDILDLIRGTYINDLDTILYLCTCVYKHKALRDKCISVFGERIVELVRSAVFKAMDSVTPKYYRVLKKDLDKVQENFSMYVNEGTEAFKALLKDIKRQHKSKKKLLTQLKASYEF